MPRAHRFVLCIGLLFAPAAAKAQDPTLPLKRVRLYETGVGYFERSGALGGKPTRLPVPSGHIDDALKTLVVLSDDAKASVAGVEFGTSVSRSMARAMAGLPPDEAPLKMHALLRSLKGASVEIKTEKTAVAGRLVELVESAESDVEDCVRPALSAKTAAATAQQPEACVMQKQPAIVVLTKAGELRRLRAAEIVSVKPTDPAFAARLGSALDALSDRSARLLKDLRVMAKSGKGVTLGYVAETPVWRVTYRLVLADKGDDKGSLQGWALLHNDTDEEWRGVQVDLVNGRPDSFLFPLAAPRYARRELITPESELSTVPQLMEETPDSMWSGDSVGAGGFGLHASGEGGGGSGEGIGLGRIGTIGHGAGTGSLGSSSSSLLSVGNLAGVAQAEGVEAGALFRYTLKTPLDLRAHGSALVPFLSDGIRARRIAWFASPGSAARSAVHVTHQGTQTLPPGPISVFADGGFAGEAALERMKPRETAVVEFGVDLDVELDKTDASQTDETKLVSYAKGQLVEHYVRHHNIAYKIENRSGSARDVFLKLDFVNNAAVHGADELAYDSKAGAALAVFKIGARQKAERRIKAEEGLSRHHDLKKLTSQKLREMAGSKAMPQKQRAILESAADLLLEAEVRRGALGKRKAELAEAEREALRYREHARALGAAKGSETIIKRLIESEDKAKKLRTRIAELRSESDERARKATATLSRLGGARG